MEYSGLFLSKKLCFIIQGDYEMGRPKKKLPEGVTTKIIKNIECLIRQCPSCDKEIIYSSQSSRWNVRLAIQENRLCSSCRILPDPWNKGLPLSEQHKLNISNSNIGKSRHSDEYKQWLKTNSIFCKTGKDSVSLNAYLKKNNITYDEYLERLPKFKKYHRDVMNITKKQDISNLPNLNLRGLAGVTGAYHLDHIISIKEGFDKNISAEIIGHITNLQFITWEDNIKKSIEYKNKIKVNKNGNI